MAVATRVYPARRRTPWTERLGPVSVTALLGALITLATVQSVVTSNWARGLQVLTLVALGGLVVGALFAQIRGLPGWLAHGLSVVLGLAWGVNRIGPLMGAALPTWKDQATELLIRAIILGRVVVNGGTGEDLLLFVAVLSLMAWALGYLTMWWLVRKGWAWRPVLLNALVLFVNLTYASPKPPVALFYLFLGAGMLLLVHQSYLARAQTWTAAMIEVPELLGWRFVASGSLVVITLLGIATFLPTRITSVQVAAVWQRVREPWQNIQNRWDRAFSNINAPSNALGSGFAGRSLELQGARSFGNAVVVEVKSQSPDGQPRADYWRATAYDRYTSVGGPDARTWADTTGQAAAATLGLSNEEQARTPIAAGEQMPQLDVVAREVITQTFTFRQNFSQPTLLAATQPISISVPINVKHTFAAVDGQTVANYSDLSLIASQRGGVRSGLSYTAASLVSTADKQSLRSAPTQYPDWVKRYLQLPEGDALSRVFAKAQEVSGGVNNPYDKAEAIQNYLRGFTYDEKIPFPPEDRDRVDWFLFDLQRGYCDYFASAMTLMLRSQGVPARIVSGYATGEYNAEKGVFEVRQNVAHTWVEAYFPGYGWQRFEPTPASYTAPPERAEDTAQTDDASNGDAGNITVPDQRQIDLEELERRLLMSEQGEATSADVLERIAQQEAQQRRAAWIQRGAAGTSLLVATLIGLVFLWRPRGVGPAAAAYIRALRLAKWASLGPKTSATPREFAVQLGEHLPAQRRSLDEIANAYTRERYSGGQPVAPASVETAWRNVRWPLVGAMLAQWIGFGRRKRKEPTRRRR
ncbi:MAG: DUF3488 and transglutaminase-like domain-containing protein [Chloroflexota bacterium]|nr:DUF3488 and transglutaminase-like domain-containing protein [Chloroflexota bacterium]